VLISLGARRRARGTRVCPGPQTGERSGAIGAGVMVIEHGLAPERIDALLR
jgi:hypothetical protein